MSFDTMRIDHRIIYGIVTEGAKILDLGCGAGELMFLLARGKNAKVQGIELSEQSIYKCVEKGLSVFHSDIDSGLPEYPDKSFDFVILNQSLQETRKVGLVLTEALRVGKRAIVGIPNFAHYRSRSQLFFRGRAPVTPTLPYTWDNSPNLHFLSITDFYDYCRSHGITVEKTFFTASSGHVHIFPNLFATAGIFVISK